MKKSALIIAIISLAAVACTTQKKATSSVNDDVYYSASKGDQTVPNNAKPQPTGAQVVTSPDNSKVQKSNSASLAEDNNDYSYAGRINRFNSKDTTKGYFDDSYTSGSTSSNNGGNNPNMNLYLGVGAGYGGMYSGFGYPYSNWGWDYGWGYPYSMWGMNYGWGYPYYGWYNPWYNPCCFCYGYNDWYYGGYSPYYTVNTYYGSRRSMFRSDGNTGAPNARSSSNPVRSDVTPNNRVSATPNYSRNNVQPPAPVIPASQEKYRYTKPADNRQTTYQRTTVRNQNQTQRQQPTPRYVRPENVTQVQRSGNVQSYSSPVYRQPKTSQEYLTPRAQNPGTTRMTNQNTGNRYNSGNARENSRQYSTPSSTRTYSSPARSSSPGNSSPSRSNSYSSPSRSGSSGSNSGGGGGGGGRRR